MPSVLDFFGKAAHMFDDQKQDEDEAHSDRENMLNEGTRIWESMGSNTCKVFSLKLHAKGVALHCKYCNKTFSTMQTMENVLTKTKSNINRHEKSETHKGNVAQLELSENAIEIEKAAANRRNAAARLNVRRLTAE